MEVTEVALKVVKEAREGKEVLQEDTAKAGQAAVPEAESKAVEKLEIVDKPEVVAVWKEAGTAVAPKAAQQADSWAVGRPAAARAAEAAGAAAWAVPWAARQRRRGSQSRSCRTRRSFAAGCSQRRSRPPSGRWGRVCRVPFPR